MNVCAYNKEIYIDPLMYEQVSLFINEEMINRDRESALSLISRNLAPLVHNVKLREVKVEWLLSLDRKRKIPADSGAILCRFIGFLLNEGVISDDILYRIVECKSLLYSQCRSGQLTNLMTTPIFNDFRNKYDLSDKLVVEILLSPRVATKDKHLSEALNNFSNKLKLSNRYTLKTKKIKLEKNRKIANEIFKETKLSTLSINHIVNFFDEELLEKDIRVLLIEILIWLNKESLITEPLLEHFLNEISKVHDAKDVNSPNYLSLFTEKSLDFTEKTYIYSRKSGHESARWILLKNNNQRLNSLLGKFFTNTTYTSFVFKDFLMQFEESLGDNINNHSLSFSYKVFCEQVEYFKGNFEYHDYIEHLIAFYLFMLQQNISIMNDIKEVRFLYRRSLVSELYNDFDIVFYQPLEDIPDSDKWIFCYDESQCTNEGVTPTMTRKLDFTGVKNNRFRQALKHYIWNQESSINNKYHNRKYILKFISFMESYMSSNLKNISNIDALQDEISLSCIIAYKTAVLSKYSNNRTVLAHIYATRDFLKHARNNEVLEVDEGYQHYLSNTRDTTYSNPQPIDDEHFPKIFKLFKEKSDESVDNKLYMLVFYLLAVTELRPTNILSLRSNCVKELNSNEFVIKTETKTSNKEIIQIPITLEIERHISEVIRITKSYREENKDIESNKYLFLMKGSLLNQYRVMSIQKFNKYLSEICSQLNIQKYTTSNIRDTHMTKAEEFIIQNNYSEMNQNILSGHKSSKVDEQHYVKTEKRKILSAVKGIRIGEDIDHNSITSSDNYDSISQTRLNKLLTSEYFVTTTEFLSYFNNQITEVDKEIINIEKEINGSTSIERMSILVNYKELLEGYKTRIINIKD